MDNIIKGIKNRLSAKSRGIKMTEEPKCTYYYKDTKLHKGAQCEAKIVKKEPILSSEKFIGKINGSKKTTGGELKGDPIPYYLYQCEKGHILYRPDNWVDVPEVTPGEIESSYGTVNKQPKWSL